jgi:hypothetical protein
VLSPIAARGVACAGIDVSPAMLDRLRAKPGAAAVQLELARMESFDLGPARFRLIYSAFRAFQHLDMVDVQLACLRGGGQGLTIVSSSLLPRRAPTPHVVASSKE